MRYYDRRKAAKRRATLQGIGLCCLMVAFAIGIYPAFKWIDCSNAKRFIAAYEACELDPDCKGMPWNGKRAYDKEKWIYYNACKQD